MVWTAILFGALLTALGVLGYFVTQQAFWPALIPAVLGLAFLVAGLLGFKQAYRQNAMHATVVLALLGLVGTFHALLQLIQPLFEKPALVVESVTAILCGVFMWLASRSFLEARRRPPSGEPPQAAAPEQQGQSTDAPGP